MTLTICQVGLSTLAALKSPMLTLDCWTTNPQGRDNNHYPAKPIHSEWAEAKQYDRIINMRRSNMMNKLNYMSSMFRKCENHNFVNFSSFYVFLERHSIVTYHTVRRLSKV